MCVVACIVARPMVRSVVWRVQWSILAKAIEDLDRCALRLFVAVVCPVWCAQREILSALREWGVSVQSLCSIGCGRRVFLKGPDFCPSGTFPYVLTMCIAWCLLACPSGTFPFCPGHVYCGVYSGPSSGVLRLFVAVVYPGVCGVSRCVVYPVGCAQREILSAL